MKKLTLIIAIILIVLAIISVMFIFNYISKQKQSEKCFDDFNASFVKENSTMLYPDFVRSCCAQPISKQASCLDQYSLLD